MLDGVRIVSLAINLPGPLAAHRLTRLGAQVTKIEPPSGDPLSLYNPDWYAELARSQEIVRLDLKQPTERDSLFAQLEGTDILLVSSRPSALDRLGLAPASLLARFPRLGIVMIVGSPSPDVEKAGHDLTYQAEAGILNPPAMPRCLIADFGGSQDAVIAALSLLFQRERTGKGGVVEVSLKSSADFFAWAARQGITLPTGGLGGAFPGYNLYETKSGWVALAALEPHFLRRLGEQLEVLGLPNDDLPTAFLARSADEWQLWADEHDIPLAVVREPDPSG